MRIAVLFLSLIISILFSVNCAFAYVEDEEELFCDEIFIEDDSLKLNLGKALPETYKKSFEAPKTKLEYKKGSISIFSGSAKSLNDYMVEDYKSTTGAVLNPEGRLSIAGGMEVTYQNPDASINSRKLYITPNLKLGDGISLTFANKFSQTSNTYEHEVGLKYSPKIFKQSSFGVTAGAVFDEESMKSQKLKFTTDLFLFWFYHRDLS